MDSIGGIMMINEYYDEFKNQYKYDYVPKTLVVDFEEWCQYMDIPLEFKKGDLIW